MYKEVDRLGGYYKHEPCLHETPRHADVAALVAGSEDFLSRCGDNHRVTRYIRRPIGCAGLPVEVVQGGVRESVERNEARRQADEALPARNSGRVLFPL